ncbi:hypothetical protein HY732_01910 [Candidatus Uhrbacteria bacterium]|nr:hypothetical protein [Candidatus Uhrbacteria bacterium]
MKTPLHIFLDTVHALGKRPFHFFDKKIQQTILSETRQACVRLKNTLVKQNLKDTHAYRVLEMIESSILPKEINEVMFIQALGNLIEVYQHGTLDAKTKKLVQELQSAVQSAKKGVLEYHLIIESVHKKGATMSEEQKRSADLNHLQNVGVFYVLEYTLQVLYEFSHLSDADKKKLLQEGLQTKAGSLPAYLPLEDTFRKDLCLKLHDSTLRERLLWAFYNFEEVLYAGNIKKIGSALKHFNSELLHAYEEKGLTTFKALLYKPFGSNVLLKDVIYLVEKIP